MMALNMEPQPLNTVGTISCGGFVLPHEIGPCDQTLGEAPGRLTDGQRRDLSTGAELPIRQILSEKNGRETQ
jgi:hypothetical protein